MEDTIMASQSPPPPPTDVKAEEPTESQPAEPAVKPEVSEGNATTPAPGPESAPTPTPTPATVINKHVVEVIEGILHRLTNYKTEEYVFDLFDRTYSS